MQMLLNLVALLPALWVIVSLIDPPLERTSGEILQVLPISAGAKIKTLMPSMLGVALLVLPGIVFGEVHWAIGILNVALIVAALAIPMKLVLTTDGIRPGWKSFRRWTEFAGVRRTSAGITLQQVRGGRGLTIWLIGSRGEDELVHDIRVLIRAAYTGRRDNQIMDVPGSETLSDQHEVPYAPATNHP